MSNHRIYHLYFQNDFLLIFACSMVPQYYLSWMSLQKIYHTHQPWLKKTELLNGTKIENIHISLYITTRNILQNSCVLIWTVKVIGFYFVNFIHYIYLGILQKIIQLVYILRKSDVFWILWFGFFARHIYKICK